ncbi:aminotransferase class IV [Raineya orbicola]|jgi:branched-chain amino acid aminotransferase/4-amino-4-deoxychorismate lyase|uniref:branched-chain-amino-acid transaminase n=1 Tax=Raineya orbicola TaxID=2016530 RepID=A0A2N3IKP2_9BACT|nr:aminotransferase class IV [Raineya orbicola]PKQ70887.1 Branched-chain amino acid aminotransferase/4-amino-4-deoxychorismate lyase [Raineya orbicola]
MDFALLNGNFVENFASNRAFEYGDGIFETIIVRKNKIFFWEKHYQRLCEAMQALSLEKPAFFTMDFVEKAIWQVAQKNNFTDAFRVKINVWRDSSGWYAPEKNEISWLIRVFPHIQKPLIKEKAIFFDQVPLVNSSISPYKTCSALPYVLAGIEKNRQKADEVILLDCHGNVADALVSNIFWLTEERVCTPALFCGGKKGIMRNVILEFCDENGIEVEESFFHKEELLMAETIFTSNVAGIEAISQIEGRYYKTHHPFLQAIRELLKA